MKILILNWRDIFHPKSGGAERVTVEHAKAWVELGHAVTWVTAGYEGGSPTEVVDGVTIVRFGGSLTVYMYAIWHVLFHGREYDVIVDEFHGFPFFSPLFTRTPVVGFIHEVAGDIWDYTYPFPLNMFGKIIERVSFLFYRHVLFWTDASSTIEELVALGIPKSHCVAIPCPIPGDIPSIHSEKEKHPTFLFVSRLVKMKGIEDVIQAFSFIVKTLPTATLKIIGTSPGHYKSKLMSLVKDMGLDDSITFLGGITEKEKYLWMAKSHILLHASVKEGWGLVVLEAASQETPSVVYNVPGLRDVVHDGKTGIVVKENSPQALAGAAVQLYNDKKQYAVFQKNGKAWIKSLDWKEVTQQSLALLQKTVHKKRT